MVKTSAQYIHHVTLNTGEVRRSPRGEVDDETISALKPMVVKMLAGGKPGIPNTDYFINGAGDGNSLVVTIWADDETPVVTIAVVLHSKRGAGLWRMMHDKHKGLALKTLPDDYPPAPWLAARFDPGFYLYNDTWDWLGDFERCLAWTFYEIKNKKRMEG